MAKSMQTTNQDSYFSSSHEMSGGLGSSLKCKPGQVIVHPKRPEQFCFMFPSIESADQANVCNHHLKISVEGIATVNNSTTLVRIHKANHFRPFF